MGRNTCLSPTIAVVVTGMALILLVFGLSCKSPAATTTPPVTTTPPATTTPPVATTPTATTPLVTTTPPTTTTPPMTTTPSEIRKVFIAAITSFFQHFADHVIVGVNLDVSSINSEPMNGAMVTIQITWPDSTTETKDVTTNENGYATVDFTIFEFGTYIFTVLGIAGDNMEYAPENNVDSSVEMLVQEPDS